MRLSAITVEHFRNLAGSRIHFRGPVTLLYGPNAQGKTNVLEAIYMLGTTRSFRENRAKFLLQEGHDVAKLSGEVACHGASHTMGLELGQRSKRYQRDGSGLPLREYLQSLPVVVLSAEDRGLVDGVPRHRRDFLDGTAVWLRPGYVDTLMEFGRTREQRNRVLKDYRLSASAELAAWTQTFLGLAQDVQKERVKTTAAVNAALVRLTGDLDTGEHLEIVYEPCGGADLAKALREARAEEIRRGAALVGPQRDGVEILLNGRPLASYGSSGQVRSALWLLKLTRVLLLSERDAQPPLFLLDDVEAELDERRVGQMMNLTQGKAQLVMTATRPLDAVWGPLERFRVEAGRVVDEN